MLGSFNYQYIITATGRRTAKHPTVSAQLSYGLNTISDGGPYLYSLPYIFEFTCVIINMKNMYNKMNGRHHICYSIDPSLAHSCIQTQIYSQYFIFFLLLTSLLFFALSSFCSLFLFAKYSYCGTQLYHHFEHVNK